MQPNQISPGTKNSRLSFILLTTFLAGSLDIAAAIFVYTVLLQKVTAIQILKGIAYGLLGKNSGISEMPLACIGLALHYFIAFLFTLFYFLVYQVFPFLKKNVIISGSLLGIFSWSVMNLLVLPLSKAFRAPLTLSGVSMGMSILILCIGIPIAFLTRYFFEKFVKAMI
ncbi:MAG: hypothetical protein WAU24_13265 [Chitinophagaceae bacterium]